MGALESPRKTDDVQVFVVVGNLHENGEQCLFYEPWINAARKKGWRRFAQYVWDKKTGLPGGGSGRLTTCHEWIFHLNKTKRLPQKTVPTIWGQGRHVRRTMYASGNTLAKSGRMGKANIVGDYKVPDSLIRVNPAGKAHGSRHPAVFPVELAIDILKPYLVPNGIIYDPMAGSGSTLLAADALGATAFCCEISPNYCGIVVDRYHKHLARKETRKRAAATGG